MTGGWTIGKLFGIEIRIADIIANVVRSVEIQLQQGW